ncbi:Do family serine endopeptidase [Ideonella sp. 4Y16]|uniref:Do family serine endopeptidase n=1 Tax=Ideonella alba TaxID=2824118 RepID=UPI001B378B1F|nr:Do family serine endopeptidase [Ideonella alba]MBQ0942945.1 Do family serine endopeptidase [Ideonella alba]
MSTPSRTLATVLATASLTAGLVAAGSAAAIDLPAWLGGHDKTATAQAAAAATTPPAVAPLPPGALPDYRSIVRLNGPAVVGVMVSGTHAASDEDGGLPPGLADDPFFQFFRGMPGLQGRGRSRGPAPQVPFRGQGSGFIVSADGLILTNAHVVREAKEVSVRLSDRREFSAKVLGSDPATDVAVLKIDARGLPTVRLGDARQIEVGDRVLAIGAPYGLEQTATQGIVSAKGRSLPGDSAVPFIQTDAAVNPGNSGGPLFDGSGSVVGINAQIYTESGGFQGLSFAIPINVALKVKDQIVAHGRAEHGRLGVSVQDVNQALAESFGMPRPDGALIAKVDKGSAAAQAGLKPGDVIISVNGEKVVQAGSLSSLVSQAAPGETLKLGVWRDRAERTLEARLGRAGDDTADAAPAGDADTPRLGLALRPLDKDERREAGAERGGLLVQDSGGAAARAGIQAGDVVLAVNGQPLTSVDQLRALLKNHPKQVALLVRRDGETIFVPVPLG